MSSKNIDLPKYYDAKVVEEYLVDKIPLQYYQFDENSHQDTYTVIMPPPNVTGKLHMGHALVTTVQDILVRYKRMQGYNVLWQPGLDHAGIATQMIVERELLRQHNIERRTLTRDQFITKVYEWKDQYGSSILNQIKRLGASCDFSRIKFTMDADSSKAVIKAFVDLHKAGLIYQDYRLVNWDTKLETAISDLEVVNKEVKSKMYYLKYYIADSDDGAYLVVATTRPETLFGDVAVIVNPADVRYQHLIGRFVILPFMDKKIPILADQHAQLDKGSGVVKITPAHDFNDFEVGKRHNLIPINILHTNGTLNDNVPKNYQQLNILQARSKVLKALEEANLLERIEDYIATIPYGDRSDTVIEPFLTKQWYLDVTSLAQHAKLVVDQGDIDILPSSWQNLYNSWMQDVKPWCISRQLWWGHRIPAYYNKLDDQIFVASSLHEAELLAKEYYGYTVELYQDEDVLDTWFSSSLWPFVTLGWPDNQELLAKVYPSDVLITGFDIIFFWVARMIMMSLFFIKQIPFRVVFIHALIRDEHGQKMSKSKGNVIDPLDVIETYGTDSLRFSLASYASYSNDIKLSTSIIENNKHFVTKLWNAYKFLHYFDLKYQNIEITQLTASLQLDVNIWILNKVLCLQNNLEEYYQAYQFNDITNALYAFVWNDYCDWYIEFIKIYLYNLQDPALINEIHQVSVFVFDIILRFLHPVMPFITQYLMEALHNNTQLVVANMSYPNYHMQLSKIAVDRLDFLIKLVAKVRQIRKLLNIAYSCKLMLYLQDNDQLAQLWSTNHELLLINLVKLSAITIVNDMPSGCVLDVVGDCMFGLAVPLELDLNLEYQRLQKKHTKLTQEFGGIADKLDNPQFIDKAKPSVVNDFKEKYDILQSELRQLTNFLAMLKKILTQ